MPGWLRRPCDVLHSIVSSVCAHLLVERLVLRDELPDLSLREPWEWCRGPGCSVRCCCKWLLHPGPRQFILSISRSRAPARGSVSMLRLEWRRTQAAAARVENTHHASPARRPSPGTVSPRPQSQHTPAHTKHPGWYVDAGADREAHHLRNRGGGRLDQPVVLHQKRSCF